MSDRSDRNEFTYKGLKFVRTLIRDDDHQAPWIEHDGHGVVTDWLRDSTIVDGKPVYDQPERLRLLVNDRDTARYYDWTQSLAKAARENWGISDEELVKLKAEAGTSLPSKTAIVARAVRLDYEYIRGWCRDEWWYVGVEVKLKGTEVSSSVWGIESNATAYIEGEVSTELAEQVIEDAPQEIRRQIDKLLETLEVLEEAIPRPARPVRYIRQELAP